ncbi:outer membrane porin protein precursor, partial [mine drainage metagenome]
MSCIEKARVIGIKSLVIALAVGTALSTPAWALDLSIYGVGDLSYDNINNGAQTSDYIHSNSSRLGFKGSHDLGNGLSVIFQYDSGVDLTGNGTGDGNGGTYSNGQIFTRARDSF